MSNEITHFITDFHGNPVTIPVSDFAATDCELHIDEAGLWSIGVTAETSEDTVNAFHKLIADKGCLQVLIEGTTRFDENFRGSF